MKPKFDNAQNMKAVQSSLATVARICFGLSTLSSSIALWSGAMSFLDSKYSGASDSMFISAITFFGVGVVCYVVDFFGITKVGKLFFTEVAGIVSGQFEKYKILRIALMGFCAFIFAMLFSISFFTSYYGSDLVKAFAMPKVDVSNVTSMEEKRITLQAATLAPYEKRRSELEKQKATELANAGNPEMRKLAKKGDDWAINELAAQRGKIEKSYTKKIDALEKEMATEKAEFAKRQNASEGTQRATTQARIDGQNAQANAVGIIALAGGVAPLIIGVMVIGVMSVLEVSEKAEKAERQAASGGGNSGGNGGNSGYSNSGYSGVFSNAASNGGNGGNGGSGKRANF